MVEMVVKEESAAMEEQAREEQEQESEEPEAKVEQGSEGNR